MPDGAVCMRHTARTVRRVTDYEPAPIDQPMAYPGLWPTGPVMVAGDDVLPVGVDAPTGDRVPILAVGSNACPAQIRRKALGGSVLLTPAVLRNHLVVYAGHQTTYGAVPATVIRWPGARCEVFLTWLTPLQHTAMDLTEGGNYHRVMLPTENGMVVGYRATTSLTRDTDGQPIRVAGIQAHGRGLPTALTQAQVQRLRDVGQI